MEENYDIIFKVVIIGDTNVGKTGLLGRYLNNEFTDCTKATVGVEFGAKKLRIKDCNVKLQIWDTAGQERYRSITNAYYKGAKGALVVYDITQKSTFESVDKWIKEVKIMGEQDLIIVLVGNKSDLEEKRQVSINEGKQKALNLGIAFIETSAKISTNVDKVFEDISYQITENILANQIEDDMGMDDLVIDRRINITSQQQKNQEKSTNCC